MSVTLILILSLFCTFSVNNETINPNELNFEGIPFRSKKATIWKNLGEVEPKKVNHECGFHSEDEQGKPFFELIYSDVIWIGNEEGGYYLDKVFFDAKGKTALNYKNKVFTAETTQKEMEDLFNQKSEPFNVSGREDENLELIGLTFDKSDDGCHFIFKDGKLVEFGYWSPCLKNP